MDAQKTLKCLVPNLKPANCQFADIVVKTKWQSERKLEPAGLFEGRLKTYT